jgi:hypothetical protein
VRSRVQKQATGQCREKLTEKMFQEFK